MMLTRYKNILPRYTEGVPAEASWHDYAADLLDKFEGFREEVYLDGKRIPTIGYGFTDPKLVGRGRISKPEAKKILKNEISTRGDSLRNILGAERFDKLADSTKAALLSYYYNYPAGFKDSTKMMTAWRNNDYNEFVRQIDAGMNDVANPGLKDRRLEEQGIIKEDPFLFPKGQKPLFQTAAQYHAQNQFKPKYLNTAGTDFSMYNTAPSSVRAVGGAGGPSFTKSQYQTNRAVETVDGMLLNNIKKINADQSQMFNSNNKILGLPNMKNGKLPQFGELPEYKNGKPSIHINPANRGKFNATKKRTGKTTEELTHSSNPLTRKRAIFAQNARKWHHK